MASLLRRLLVLLASMVFSTGMAHSAGAQERELIAVMELNTVGASQIESAALGNKVRDELLSSGAYTLVDRSRLQTVLDEQALQQRGCTTRECAVQVGQILGVRKIVTGEVVKLESSVYQLTLVMIDVETAEIVRGGSRVFEGSIVKLIDEGVPALAAQLAPEGAPPESPAAPTEPPAAPEPFASDPPASASRSAWPLVAGGAMLLVPILDGAGVIDMDSDLALLSGIAGAALLTYYFLQPDSSGTARRGIDVRWGLVLTLNPALEPGVALTRVW